MPEISPYACATLDCCQWQTRLRHGSGRISLQSTVVKCVLWEVEQKPLPLVERAQSATGLSLLCFCAFALRLGLGSQTQQTYTAPYFCKPVHKSTRHLYYRTILPGVHAPFAI